MEGVSRMLYEILEFTGQEIEHKEVLESSLNNSVVRVEFDKALRDFKRNKSAEIEEIKAELFKEFGKKCGVSFLNS